MKISLKPLERQVMVITGASSGIGLVTAKFAAEAGAKVVLVGRNQEALDAVRREIQAEGGEADVIAADVAFEEEVERIAAKTLEKYGRIDTWVNNAGVSIWGRLSEVSHEDHQRMFNVNFWGVVYGSLIAAKHLKKQGGAIINLGSVASDMSLPLQGMYSATKHAIKGFTDALRMELEEEGSPISVTLIKPTSINTPFPQHAKNYLPREPKLPDPVYAPEEVAHAILHASEHPIRDINVGGSGKVMTTLAHWAPRAMDWVGEKVMVGQQMQDHPPRDPRGILFASRHEGQVHGSHPGPVMSRSLYTRAILHPVAAATVVASLGVIVGTIFTAAAKHKASS